MEIVPGRPDIVLIPKGELEASQPLLRLYGLYRRAVVLRAELLGTELLHPARYMTERHEGADYERLRLDLSREAITIAAASGVLPDPLLGLTGSEMVRELDRVIAATEVRLALGPEVASSVLLYERLS